MKLSQSWGVRLASALAGVFISCSGALMAQTTSPPARLTRAVDELNLVTLHGNTHPLARPEYDQGAAPDDLPMERMLLLLRRSPEQEAALRKLLEEQQVKSSPRYHRWLTPEQFGRQFGPAKAEIARVTQWLTSRGFQVNRVGVGGAAVEFSGTAGLVREALHTEIHKYIAQGEAHWANASDPRIPAALAPVVAGVVSLNNFPRQRYYRRLGTFERSKATGKVQPLFTFPSPSNGQTLYAVGPTDFATIYNVLPEWSAGIDGTGQTIAIAGDSNINIQDVQDFRSMFGLPANDPQIILDGPDPGVLGGDAEAEADVDVEWAGAVAKGANVDLVVSQSTESSFGGDLSALYIIDNNLAPVMSVSFGSCEAALGTTGNTFYNSLWEQGAAEGVTIIVAAGDTGSAGCDSSLWGVAVYGLAVNGIASTPFNVAVGGTDFDDAANLSEYWNSTNVSPSQSSVKSYIPERTWNDSCAQSGQTTGCTTLNPEGLDVIAGGGGPSNCAISNGDFCMSGYAKPSWQTGNGVPNDAVRDIPDVSLFSSDGTTDSTSFYPFCQMDANSASGSSTSSCDLNAPYLDFQGAGGTSFAAPTFAGIMAMVIQKTGGERQGNANYVLYPLAAQSGASCASNAAAVGNSSCIFYDVVTGNNSVACRAGYPNCSNTSLSSKGYGILVDPANNSLPAWMTTPGYDLATGLGSVNVTNLVKQWSSVSFAPTTTTLALSTVPPTSPVTVTHGQPVNVGIQVASATGGTPTGQVSLIAQTGSTTSTATDVATFTLANGTASGAKAFLPGGTYDVTAHYAGDGTFGASDSTPPIPVTVSPESSATHVHVINGFFPLSFTATNALYGDYYVRVDVTNSSNQLCTQVYESIVYPCPTGQVILTANNQPLPDQSGTAPNAYMLNSSGYLEDQFPPLSPGSYNVVASYSGDNSYQPSSSTATLTVAKGPTFTSVFASPAGGNSVNLLAYVQTVSAGVEPTGTVQFLNGSVPVSGTVTYTGAAYSPTTSLAAYLQATVTTPLTAMANITAQYSGDANYEASTSSVTPVPAPDFVLAADPTSLSIASPGQSAASAISVAENNGFTGTVNLTCSVPAAMSEASCSLNPNSLTSSGSVALLIATTAPSAAGSRFTTPIGLLPGVALLFCALLLVIATRLPARKFALGLLAAALLAATFVGCGGGASSGGGGGGGSNPGTPTGNYTITVMGSSGSVTHSLQINVNVQ
jgi:hypothetical protein